MNVIKYFIFFCSAFSLLIKNAKGTQDLIAQIPGVSELAMRIASLTDIGSTFFSAERSNSKSIHEKIAAKTRSLDPEIIQIIRDTAEGITSFLNDLRDVAFAVESALSNLATRDIDKSKLVSFRDTLEVAYSKTLHLFQKYQDAFGEKIGANTVFKGDDNDIAVFPSGRGTSPTRGDSSTSRLSGLFTEDTLLNPVNALRGDLISNRLISILDADNLNLSNSNNNKPESSISNVFGRLTRRFSNDAKSSRSENSNADNGANNDANIDSNGNELSSDKDISQRKLRDLQKAYREWRESIDKLRSFSDAFKSASISAMERSENNRKFQETNVENPSNRRALMVSLADYDKVVAGIPVAATNGFYRKALRNLIAVSDRASVNSSADMQNPTNASSPATSRTMRNPPNNDMVQRIPAAFSPQALSSVSPLPNLSYIASAPSNMLASAEAVIADTRDTLIDRATAPFVSDNKKPNGHYNSNNNLLITPVSQVLLLPAPLQSLSTLNSLVSVPSTMIAAADLALTSSRDVLLNSPAAIRDVLLNRPTSSSGSSSSSALIKGIGQPTLSNPTSDYAFKRNVSNDAVENVSPIGSFENALHSLNERLKQVTQNPGI